ncbi:GNAT family N-acetyltransferase [Geminocystis sp.]|uniref:GNAT family N-acetyltransferase n=1 Tax=Geminocystis sp. TaxID=2664100 RepID=UPI00359405BC
MFQNLQLRKAVAEVDQGFYLKCFLSDKWSLPFDLNLHNSNLDQEEYINQKIYSQYPDLIRLIVYEQSTLRKIGFGNILIEDHSIKRCSLNGGVDPDLLAKGYGSVGLYLSLKYIFLEMKMNKVTCQVYSFNVPSFKLLESAGFQLDGILRQHAFNYLTQEFVDVKIYSLLKHEFMGSRIYQTFKILNFQKILCQEN